MSATKNESRKLFTVEEANKTLPLVRAIVADLVRCSRDVMDRRQRLNHLLAGRDLQAGDVYEDELAEIEKDLQRDSQRLREYVEELEQLGVLPKGPEGLVDFPALLDGRQVYLCWKLGEPEVLYWHEIDEGFDGRQPLTADSCSGADGTSADASDEP